MTNSVAEKVFIFTPVETNNALSSFAAHYLSPFFGNREIAVFDPTYVDTEGNQACFRKNQDPSCFITSLKIATYILSLGIFPLLAMLLNIMIRCGTRYYYISDDIVPVHIPLSDVGNPPPKESLESDNASAQSLVPDKLYTPTVYSPLLPFLDYPGLQCYFNTNRNAQQLKEHHLERLERSIFSRIEIFDRAHYQTYWGVEITDAFDAQNIDTKVLRSFLKTFYGPNPIRPGRTKDGCLIPTVVPERIVDDGGSERDFTFNLLEKLAEYPKSGGNAAKYSYSTYALQQQGKTRVEQAHLAIVLKDVIERHQAWELQVERLQVLNEETQYGCETMPDGLSLATTALAEHAVRGNRAFGDATGMEGQMTYSRTRELIRLDNQHAYYAYHLFPMLIGAFRAGPISDAAIASLNVTICAPYNCEDEGVAVQRKFKVIET